MAHRVQTLVNQITVPGFGLVPVAGTVIILEDADFQKISPSFFNNGLPKLRDLGATTVDPPPAPSYATTLQLASLVNQLELMNDAVTQARQAAATAQAVAQSAQTTAQARTGTASQTAQATAALTTRVDGMATDMTAVQGALSGLVSSWATKENTGVAASLLANHSNAVDPHAQYHTNARADARYAALSHAHAVSGVTGLQAALDAKDPIGAATAALSSHLAATDPHSQYAKGTALSPLQTAITALQAKNTIIQQPAAITVPAIKIGGSVILTVTWPTPMPHANYACIVTLDTGAYLVGKLSAALVPASRTTTSCQVTVMAGSTVVVTLGQAFLTVAGIAS